MNKIAGTSALITDIDRRKALPIIRALGKEGVRVIGVSYNKLPMGALSKYCKKVYLCPDYRGEPESFLSEIENICNIEKPDVIYPLEDVVLSLLNRHREIWTNISRALIPDTTSLERAYDKWQTIQFARKCSIPIPESFCPEHIDEVIELARRNEEWVIKPRKSSGSRGIRYVEYPDQLVKIYKDVSANYPQPIIQRRVHAEGPGVGAFFLLSQDLSPLAIFGHRRLREYPITGGPSTLRESYRNNALLESSLSLVQQMGCVGVSMVEYKWDRRTGNYVLMEVNPRFWGSLQLAIQAGVNFPVLYQKAALGIDFEPVLEYQLGVMCRWLWPGDILHFLSNPKRFHLQPSFFKFQQPNLGYDILSRDDPLPMFGIIIEGLRKLISRSR